MVGLQSLWVKQATSDLLEIFTPRGSLWSTNQKKISHLPLSLPHSCSFSSQQTTTAKPLFFYSKRTESAANPVWTPLFSGVSSSLTRNGPHCTESLHVYLNFHRFPTSVVLSKEKNMIFHPRANLNTKCFSIFVLDTRPLTINLLYQSGEEKLAITSCFPSTWRPHCLMQNETVN